MSPELVVLKGIISISVRSNASRLVIATINFLVKLETEETDPNLLL